MHRGEKCSDKKKYTPKKENVASKTLESTNPPSLDLRQVLFPAIKDRRIDDSCSDDDAS